LKNTTPKKKKKAITTVEMEIAIAKYFGIRQHIIVPNLSWGLSGLRHECDLFVIKRSGYAIEIEIKRTKADFLADFKKGHNHIDRKKRISEFYYAFPDDIYEKCANLVPENAGVFICKRYDDRVFASVKKSPVKIKEARKLTTEEQLKVASLGTMRIWSLKQKLIKAKDE
jgi:hypothetical protein